MENQVTRQCRSPEALLKQFIFLSSQMFSFQKMETITNFLQLKEFLLFTEDTIQTLQPSDPVRNESSTKDSQSGGGTFIMECGFHLNWRKQSLS